VFTPDGQNKENIHKESMISSEIAARFRRLAIRAETN
jgi:hypothetical protein